MKTIKTVAVIYHSAHGHTEHIANHVLEGAQSVPGIEVDLLKAEDLTGAPKRPEGLRRAAFVVRRSASYIQSRPWKLS